MTQIPLLICDRCEFEERFGGYDEAREEGWRRWTEYDHDLRGSKDLCPACATKLDEFFGWVKG